MTNIQSTVRVRIGPSPTGEAHIGIGYIALFNYVFAKKYGGKFILRIEDTDKKRFNKYSENSIINSLKWLGIVWDEGPDIGGRYGPYRQSERKEIYKTYIDKLFKFDKVYWCICTHERLKKLKEHQISLKQPSRYDGFCRKKSKKDILNNIIKGKEAVVRLKVPLSGCTIFQDMLRGSITISNSNIDDQILLKSDGFPTYHFANVVDDYLMQISHVLRGEEWISSTPKHVLLYEFLKISPPKFCHLPLLRNIDKTKVSKRENSVSITYYRQAGFYPDAMINFLGLISFSFKDGRDVFSIYDFIKEFSIKQISLGSPIFDIQKLLWLNNLYISKKLTNYQIVKYLQKQFFSYKYLYKIVPLVKGRLSKFEDFIKYYDFFFVGDISTNPIYYLIEDVGSKKSYQLIYLLLSSIGSLMDFSAKNIERHLKEFCIDNHISFKSLLMSIRMMITGKKISSPLFKTIEILGKERCLYRIKASLKILKSMQ